MDDSGAGEWADDATVRVGALARAAGAKSATVWLADYSLRYLVAVEDAPPGSATGEPLTIDGSLAGRTFRTGEPVVVEEPAQSRVWCQIGHGAQRLGVLEVVVAGPPELRDATVEDVCASLGDQVATYLIAKNPQTDVLARTRRLHPLTVAAEMQWSVLPPLASSGVGVSVAGMLEPAHSVGGDAFDYCVDPGRAQMGIFDAMGHGLPSAMLAAVAVGAYRNARRSALGLADTLARMEQALLSRGGDVRTGSPAFVTAALLELDTVSGLLRWCLAAHPPPLQIREGRLVSELSVEPSPPLGLGYVGADAEIAIGSVRLQPGDAVLAYTDGLVDTRSPDGSDSFTIDRLVDFVGKAAASGLSTPETLRNLSHAIVDFHGASLRDDATVLLVTWHP